MSVYTLLIQIINQTRERICRHVRRFAKTSGDKLPVLGRPVSICSFPLSLSDKSFHVRWHRLRSSRVLWIRQRLGGQQYTCNGPFLRRPTCSPSSHTRTHSHTQSVRLFFGWTDTIGEHLRTWVQLSLKRLGDSRGTGKAKIKKTKLGIKFAENRVLSADNTAGGIY